MPSRARNSTLLLAAALAACACFAWPAEALAQCALCRTAAEQAGAETANALNLGILMLLIPPVAIFCTIFAVAVRHHKEGGEE
jgi:cytosine/uracil/thiamine/allantoin permease